MSELLAKQALETHFQGAHAASPFAALAVAYPGANFVPPERAAWFSFSIQEFSAKGAAVGGKLTRWLGYVQIDCLVPQDTTTSDRDLVLMADWAAESYLNREFGLDDGDVIRFKGEAEKRSVPNSKTPHVRRLVRVMYQRDIYR